MSEDKDYQRMLDGKLYVTDKLHEDHREFEGKVLVQKINQLPQDRAHMAETMRLEMQLVHGKHKQLWIQPPFQVDFGKHIEIGENFYCNVDAILLDTNWIRIGDNVKIGPRVNLFTAGHPIDTPIRVSMLEYAKEIHIGDNTWIGGNVTVVPGVSIGKNCVIGAGAVVTKDIPDGVIAVGNPARILRKIGKKDHDIWQAQADDYYRDWAND
ncbi:sugar O-acetyltransferase [Lacticaseibacillus pabuli]|uniref:Acetyltransferase n=2 Tax=Lacticaseibacillus pabuli TaxID=3025672 RepID=A0ABY7WT32_9LACO|nr:sugar O-acetyltransferase [Lacticaseibacillus sp. KACC 23028]WDF83296.1 sugar O-acetyltransferase [Lacticaseibacillus sp. KACC 23028]